MSKAQKRSIIYSLRDSGMKFRDPSKDIRGRDVIGRDGEKLGMVEDLLLDDYESRLRFIQIAHGGFLGIGRDTFILPVNTITKIEERQIHVDRTRDDVLRESQYLPELEEGVDTGPTGWFEESPAGLPGTPIQ